MRGKIHGRSSLDERADAVKRVARGGHVVRRRAELVRLERGVAVGDVAGEHVEEAVLFDDDDRIALGMAGGKDVADAWRDRLRPLELVVGAVRERTLDQLESGEAGRERERVLWRNEYLGVREAL